LSEPNFTNFPAAAAPSGSEIERSAAEPTNATTILVVAAHALVRAGLGSLLRETPGLAVVAEAEHAAAILQIAARVRPDVVLLDEPPCDPDSQAAISMLCRTLPATCVLCLARDSGGAFGDALCVPTNAGITELCSVLGAALGGRCAACLLRAQCVAPRIAVALSRREKQVAICIARGMPSKQIAARLGIALRTVNTYRECLARKLGASSAAVVTRFVLEAKLDTIGALPSGQ
jgi:DNA-binding NarL/FixJ family response regulator